MLKKTWYATLVVFLLTPGALYSQSAGKILSIQGSTEVRKAGAAPWQPATVQQNLDTSDAIRTLAQSRAVVLLADETQLKLNANTTLELRSVRQSSNLMVRVAQASAAAGNQTLLNLGTGQVWVRSKLTPANVRVSTPAVTAAIRGTEFDLRVADDGESVITMLEGVVDFSNDQGALQVASGEQGRARIGQAPTKTVLLRPRDAVQWVLFYPGAVSPADYPFLRPDELKGAFAEASARRAAAPGDVPNLLRLARAQHDLGQRSEAEATLREAMAAAPQDPEVRTDLGWLYLESDRVREAVEMLIRIEPPSDRSLAALAMAYYRVGDMRQFFATVQRADASRSTLAATQAAFAELLYGNATAARTKLEKIPPSDVLYAVAQGLLSNVFLAQNDKESALKAAEAAVKAGPATPSAWLSLSLAQQSYFRIPEALESARQARRLDPSYVASQVQEAKLLFSMGNTGEAEKIARDGLQRNPSEAGLNSLLGFVLLAQAKTGEAETYFRKAISQDSTRGEPYLGLGIAAMRDGRSVDSAQSILIASTIEPEISTYQSYLGKAFYDQRRFEMALGALDRAKELDPNDPTPHLYSGIFYNDLSRPGRAVREFTRSIELNDNRAVYRSRFLLDEDRATRNVNLANAYNRLYLSEWGNYEALKSQMADPTNSSAHIFLAQTYLNLRGRTQAAGSEQLLARMLLPANANSFNSFNDYTTLFEAPRMYWTLGGSFGSFDQTGATLINSGGTNRFAYGVIGTYFQTNGYRPQNDDRLAFDGVAQFKLALTPHTDFLFLATHGQANTGDRASAFISPQNDPNRRFHDRRDRAEFGYHAQLRPGSDLLLYFSGEQISSVVDDPDGASFAGITIGRRASNRRPDLDWQAEHIFKTGPLTLRYGFDIFEGKNRDRRSTYYPAYGDFPPYELVDDPETQHVRYKDAYVHTDWTVHPRLVLTGALHYDWANDNNFGDLETKPMSKWNPQAGVFFMPRTGTAIRYGFSRALQTHTRERIAPTNISGFVIQQNDPALSQSTSNSFGWDQRVGGSSFFRGSAYYRDRRTPVLAETDEGFTPSTVLNHFHGADLVWDQIVTENLSVVPQYSFTRAEEVSSVRHEHDASLKMFFISARRIWLSVGENYIRQGGYSGQTRVTSSFFTTDLSASYELPRKLGLVSFGVINLFDHPFILMVDPLALDPRVPRRQMTASLRFNF